MLSKKLPIKKTGFLFLIIAGLFLTNINFVEAESWVPITDLSSFGIPADTEVTLSDFIITLYNFLLSAVGIAAMFMIVVGGFRYLTAAGNAASLSEAKDIIYNAIYGLLLAICAWVFISAINPDLIYLKQPGTTVSHGDYSCAPAGTACNTCTGGDGCSTAACAPVDPDCATALSTCAAGDGCVFGPCPEPDPDCAYKMCCSEYQTGTSMCSAPADGLCKPAPKRCTSATISTEYLDLDDGILKCECLDGEEVHLVPYADCDNACKSEGHCGWNFLVVRVNTDSIKEDKDLDVWDFTDSDKNKMYDFFLTNDGTWGGFDVTVDSYAPAAITYECAILVTARKSITIPLIGLTITGDYRNIFWVEPGTEIGMKNGLSMEKEVTGNYKQCCEQNLGADPACKLDHPAMVPGCDWGNPGTGAPPFMHCAEELFNTSYAHLAESACNDCSGALSVNYYRPRHMICDPNTGMWR